MPKASAADDVRELRTGARGREIISHINYSQLERVRSTRFQLAEVRADVIRLGLFELAEAEFAAKGDFLRLAQTKSSA